jgi:hypothetical protein
MLPSLLMFSVSPDFLSACLFAGIPITEPGRLSLDRQDRSHSLFEHERMFEIFSR